MRTALARLGELVRVIRTSRGLTQEQLASNVNTKTNRSAIAHLEQGLRLPKKDVLRPLCSFLGIPEMNWKYLETLYSEQTEVEPSRTIDFPNIVCIAGIQGSGKSTLARGLAAAMSAVNVPEETPATKYLPDLGSDPKRWAFETQLAFFCFKALQILQKIQSRYRLVIDRSLLEDVRIYAQLFRDHGDIDERSFQTYAALADYFLGILPSPDLIILCECPPEIAFDRIHNRGRSDKDLHNLERIRDLDRRYRDLFGSEGDFPLYKVDTLQIDLRKPEVLARVINEAISFWKSKQRKISQIELQLSGEISVPNSPQSFVPYTPLYPIAYIAAPFTEMATSEVEIDSKQLTLFDMPALHGRIGKGKYRDVLSGISRALENLGIKTILPHRDVNQWGDISVPPGMVMKKCTDHVMSCDLFVGLIGNSSGSHYEFGIAIGMGKPTIIIHCPEIRDSYLARGTFSLRGRVLDVPCNHLREIPLVFNRPDVRSFISRELGVSLETDN